jgi:hypothetical protein
MPTNNVLESISYWTIPPGIHSILSNLKKMVLTSRDNNAEELRILSKNRVLNKCHSGKRCFILACGPSINQQDLSFLKNELCIAVSNSFVHPLYNVIKPKYHCIAPYHLPITEDAFNAWLHEMSKSINDSIVFFGLSDKTRVETVPKLFNNSVFLDLSGLNPEIEKNGFDLSKPLLPIQSVTIMALQIALAMGCNPIYLLGCDHDWILHIGESSHFYDEDKHALNRNGYNEWTTSTDFASHCSDYVRLWDSYKALFKLAQAQSVDIFNATRDGLLDVFPRVKFEDVES